jgi:hypothetical protein
VSIPRARFSIRQAVIGITCLETVFWLYLVIGGLNDALPFAKAYGGVAAVLGTLVFVPFVLPALLLAVTKRGVPTAAWLSSIAALMFLYDPLIGLITAFESIPLVGLYVAGVVVAILATARTLIGGVDMPERS